MGTAINCHGPRPTPEQFEAGAAAVPNLSRYLAGLARVDCSAVYERASDPSRVLTSSRVPTLVANGATDPTTPPWAARAILPGLSNGRYVEFAFTGHGALLGTGECGRSILFAFLTNPEGDLDTACAQEIQPPAFLTDWRKTRDAHAFIENVQDGARPVLPALSLLMIAAAFLAYPLAASATGIDARLIASAPARLPLGRLLSWLGSAVGLAATGLACWLIVRWINEHPLAVPVGLPTSIAWAGWLALAAALLAVAGAVMSAKAVAARRHGVGTLIGGVVTALGAFGILVFLFSIGAGPI